MLQHAQRYCSPQCISWNGPRNPNASVAFKDVGSRFSVKLLSNGYHQNKMDMLMQHNQGPLKWQNCPGFHLISKTNILLFFRLIWVFGYMSCINDLLILLYWSIDWSWQVTLRYCWEQACPLNRLCSITLSPPCCATWACYWASSWATSKRRVSGSSPWPLACSYTYHWWTWWVRSTVCGSPPSAIS